MGKLKDLTSVRFGKLLVVSKNRSEQYKSGRKVYWDCLCECGNFCIVQGNKLNCGQTKSCGCLRKRSGQDHFNYTGYNDITGKYWTQLVSQAEQRGLEVSITIEDVWNKYIEQDRKCNLTGLDILFSTNKKLKTASVDRIDSDKGYTIDNIQIVHKDLNTMKMDFDQDYFIKICRLVTERSS